MDGRRHAGRRRRARGVGRDIAGEDGAIEDYEGERGEK